LKNNYANETTVIVLLRQMFVYFRKAHEPNEALTKIMKLILRGLWLCTTLLGVSLFATSQKRTDFLDPLYQVVKDSTAAKFIRNVERQSDSLYYVSVTDKSGQVMMLGSFIDAGLEMEQGHFKYFYANGTHESEGNYKRGVKSGTWHRWNFNGVPKPDRFYPDEAKPRVPRSTHAAAYPGGMDSLQNFIRENLKYPDAAIDRQIEGTVYITFMIDQAGDLRHAEVSRGVHYLLDDEALRLISMMPDWSPATRNGVPVESSFIMPITFDLKTHEESMKGQSH
jgi:TonB family protein